MFCFPLLSLSYVQFIIDIILFLNLVFLRSHLIWKLIASHILDSDVYKSLSNPFFKNFVSLNAKVMPDERFKVGLDVRREIDLHLLYIFVSLYSHSDEKGCALSVSHCVPW